MIYSRTMTRPITMQSLNHTATRYHRNIMLPMDSVSDWADKWPRLTTAGCRQKTSLSPTFPAVRHRSACRLSAEAEIAKSKASAGVLVIDDCLAFSLSSLRSFPYLNVAVVGVAGAGATTRQSRPAIVITATEYWTYSLGAYRSRFAVCDYVSVCALSHRFFSYLTVFKWAIDRDEEAKFQPFLPKKFQKVFQIHVALVVHSFSICCFRLALSCLDVCSATASGEHCGNVSMLLAPTLLHYIRTCAASAGHRRTATRASPFYLHRL